MDRKSFLKKAGFLAIGFSAFGKVVRAADDPTAFEGDCETTNDILGPFYREDAPIRYDLTTQTDRGSRVILQGQVFGDDCETPIKNALVEIWQCDADGEYDNTSPAFRMRAGWKTDNEGEYAFKTILPGKYKNGRLYRPAHIHFRVRADNHQELVSQVYFEGDPHINDDPWASHPSASKRILPIVLEDTKGNLTVRFDIYLKSNP